MSYLKIERENGNHDEVSFIFRFIKLTNIEKDFIENQFNNYKINFKTNSSSEDGYVIISKFSKKLSLEIVKKIITDLNLNEKKYGIFASIISSYDHSGFSFPKEVIEFTRYMGGTIDISVINLF